MAARLSTRRATVADLDAMLANVQAGFDSFAEFAPPTWEPPVAAADRDRSSAMLADEQTWALLCLDDRRPVGHVSFCQARVYTTGADRDRLLQRPAIPGLAHFWQLFVLPEYWGSGVGAQLHNAAIDEMCRRGYERTRLFTPTGNARARKFYERRGWTAAGDQWNSDFALMLTEYRLTLE